MTATPIRPTMDGHVRVWLRLEGVAALICGVLIYQQLGGDLVWFLLLLFLPDLSMIGYARGPRTGAFVYDVIHNWAVGLAVLGAGLVLDVPAVALAGAILISHTGMDRMLGYGLKLATGFTDTHLGRIGKTRPADPGPSHAAIEPAAG